MQILDSHLVKTNPFGTNITGENSYRRAERICAALHLISNHVPENEPLRVALRKGSITLLDDILELRSGFRIPASEKGQTTLATLRELVSLVRLLAIAGYVSAENVAAVVEALDELGVLIVASQRSSLAEQFTVQRVDLMPPTFTSITERQTQPHVAPVRRAVRRPLKDKKDASLTTSVTAGARSNQILDILRLGGNLGIKDIVANLPEYSEKMIQRELANLVLSLKVIKVGAKRWSRYQIVT